MGELFLPKHARGFTYVQDQPPDNPKANDTWYDTSSGRMFLYQGGWKDIRKFNDLCLEKNPAYVRIEPVSQEITVAGGYVRYTVTVRNVDLGVCGEVTFTLEVVDSNPDEFEPSTLDQTTVTLGPYQETTVTLTVRDKASQQAVVGVNRTFVRVYADDHPVGQSNVITTRLKGEAWVPCTNAAPTVTITPGTATVEADGGTATYTVTVRNNDSGSDCQAVTFTLEVVDSNLVDFDPSTLDRTTVDLLPGEEATVTLTVKDRVGAATGDGTNTTYVRVSAPDHPTVQSNEVTTSLSDYAATGWKKAAPGLVLDPDARNIVEDGGTATFTLIITNQDEGVNAQATTFTLSVSDSNTTDFEPSTLSQTTVTLDPGASTTVTLTAKDRLGGATAGGVNSITVTATAPDHPTTTSNTATVSLVGEALTGWSKNAPTVTISPTSQDIAEDGGTATYTVTITNNDTGVDAEPVEFALAVTDDNTTDFEPSTLSQNTVTLNPGDSATVTLTVKDRVGAATAGGVNNTYVTVTAPDHPTVQSNTVTTRDVDAAQTGWAKNAPTVAISPTSQDIATDGGSVDYTVTITNNDTGVEAQATTFTLTVTDSNTTDFEASTLSTTTVTLDPGASTTVTLTVKDKLGGFGGDGVNETVVTASATDHPDGVSNTVTTTLVGEALTGWSKNAPSLTISPTAQTITTDGGSVTYTLTVTNNDTGVDAQATTFSLTVHDSNTTDFAASTLAATTVTLDPGASTTVTLTVTDRLGGATAGGTNDTYVTATATDHPDAQSNTVTTTLEGEALTGWTKNAPTVSITPSSQDISVDGDSVQYTVTITNNDTGVDAQAVTFTLSVSDSNTVDFDPSSLSATSVTLNPGDSTTVTLTVKDKLGAASITSNTTTVTASATDHPTGSASVTTTLSGTAATGCAVSAPSVSISPASQTITADGGSVQYTVTVTNNDSGASCEAVTFSLSVTDSNTTNFEPSTLSATSVTLGPGESTTVTLTVTDKAGDYPGTAVSNSTYVTVSAPDHPTAQSNTVTTTADNAAVTPGYGYVCGGKSYGLSRYYLSTIERFQYPFDSGATIQVGELSYSVMTEGGHSSSLHGYSHSAGTDTAITSGIFRLQFPFDEGTATIEGYMSNLVTAVGACSSSAHGYIFGGRYVGSYSTIDRYTFPLDGGEICQAVGYLYLNRRGLSGCSSSTHGYGSGGFNYDYCVTLIDRFTFPFESGTANAVGNLSVARENVGSCSSSLHGFVCGGNDENPAYFSMVERFSFPLDSGVVSRVGDLSGTRTGSACSSSTHGYLCAGRSFSNYISTIDRFQFPFDAGVAVHVGNLLGSKVGAAACSNVDPHLRW